MNKKWDESVFEIIGREERPEIRYPASRYRPLIDHLLLDETLFIPSLDSWGKGARQTLAYYVGKQGRRLVTRTGKRGEINGVFLWLK